MTSNTLSGSERIPMREATAAGRADPNERLEVSIVLRRTNADALSARMAASALQKPVGPHLTREEFERKFGASDADIAAVKKFANSYGLAVVQEHAGRRTVVLSGTVSKFNEAFGVSLQEFHYPGGSYRGRVGALHLPKELQDKVEAVLGLDNRPAAQPHFRASRRPGPSEAPATSYTPLQVASLYNFPPGTGKGECVAIIELDGGEKPADLKAYFSRLGLSSTPNVSVLSIDHGRNKPTGDPNGPDGEVMLDIEVVGAIAPQANIAVYFAPNTDAGFLDAITSAIHDTKNRPSVISISWGSAESGWTQQALAAFDSAFQAAAAMGITVCVASGDGGSSDGVADGADHVDFPASSPHVLACGGTRIQVANSALTQETVWNDGAQGGAGGGGVSSVFARPAWQAGLNVTRAGGAVSPLAMRGVPDIAGDADPQSGYVVRIDGTETVIGGTSAVAPLWAGLIARINATNGSPVGFINPKLYSLQAAFNDIKQGDNGSFFAAPGWDACTGLGSPNGAKLAAALATPPIA